MVQSLEQDSDISFKNCPITKKEGLSSLFFVYNKNAYKDTNYIFFQ